MFFNKLLYPLTSNFSALNENKKIITFHPNILNSIFCSNLDLISMHTFLIPIPYFPLKLFLITDKSIIT